MTAHQFLCELGQAARQVLNNVRKMAARGDSPSAITSYLRECHGCFLQSSREMRRFAYVEILADVERAIRYASPNAELLGALVVVEAASLEGGSGFRSLSLSAAQRIRSEIREHTRLGVCDPEDIRMGLELALSSLQPLAAA